MGTVPAIVDGPFGVEGGRADTNQAVVQINVTRRLRQAHLSKSAQSWYHPLRSLRLLPHSQSEVHTLPAPRDVTITTSLMAPDVLPRLTGRRHTSLFSVSSSVFRPL